MGNYKPLPSFFNLMLIKVMSLNIISQRLLFKIAMETKARIGNVDFLNTLTACMNQIWYTCLSQVCIKPIELLFPFDQMKYNPHQLSC